ncbi:MAG: glycosyltransferase family 2 protein [Candidatus Bathyarchaeota archaeon]|nr:glycosyltransferase family 2 protein [Candidatus Bathyarchaeota archaeon]
MTSQFDELVDVSVVFPAHNEAKQLETAVLQVDQALKETGYTYEIIVAEDGSTDGTDTLADALSKKMPQVKHIHGEQRLGRGRALNATFKKSQGKIFVYMDVDLATDLNYLKELVDSIKIEGYDFSTGSRMLQQSKVERSGTRSLASKSYNFLVRLFLGSKIKDHQCGFKAFKREPTLKLIDEVQAPHWFWDTEILVRAQRSGYKVKEIAVDWISGSDTKVKLFHDSWSMFRQVISLWWTIHFKKK